VFCREQLIVRRYEFELGDKIPVTADVIVMQMYFHLGMTRNISSSFLGVCVCVCIREYLSELIILFRDYWSIFFRFREESWDDKGGIFRVSRTFPATIF